MDKVLLANVAIITLGPSGLVLAKRLKKILPRSEIHGLEGRVNEADLAFADTINHLGRIFTEGRPIVCICSTGIVIRALASLISNKLNEPPVISVAEDGSSIVPLLGGHRGANKLVKAISEFTGGHACITTAGDIGLGLALDNPPKGWHVSSLDSAKAITQMLLAREPVSLVVEAGDASWISESKAKFLNKKRNDPSINPIAIRVTDRMIENPGKDLILNPPVLALGVGCERFSDSSEVIELAETTLSNGGYSHKSVAVVVSIDVKSDEDAVHALAQHFKVPARFFPADKLEAEYDRLANPSNIVFEEVGCHGVAEGAALAAVGADGKLLIEKKKSSHATCAVAKSYKFIDPLTIGHAQGKLSIVGIGPGADEWRTPEVTATLFMADEVVGYSLYLDLIKEIIGNTPCHISDLGREEERACQALNLAAKGRRVVLVCSGDAGIYALATLVYELLDSKDNPEWNRINVSVAPGVSALQAAAARIGAPLGHDFCVISLSDLLTSQEKIEHRLRAAAEGDFVVALYNPVSKRRKKLLALAQEILLEKRTPETPVIIARNLGRLDESVKVVSLIELKVDMVDMLTLVLVGSSSTRIFKTTIGERVYTPRGYETKLGKN